jgi:hypothetical protein
MYIQSIYLVYTHTPSVPVVHVSVASAAGATANLFSYIYSH